jgi:pimeloyl-ACP methyl ester carboxylesterase
MTTEALRTFVLVHPAWFGGWCWKKITPLLRTHGYDVRTPTLTGLGDRAHLARPEIGLNIHIEDIVNLLKYEDLSSVVLVGNSSGGMVITGVADQVPEQIAHIVYVDAFVPQDGQTMLDLIPPDRRPPMEALVQNEGQGWLVPRFAPPPWEKIVPEVWRITDEADLRWVLPRLRPTPFGHQRAGTPQERRGREAAAHLHSLCAMAECGVRPPCRSGATDAGMALPRTRDFPPAIHHASARSGGLAARNRCVTRIAARGLPSLSSSASPWRLRCTTAAAYLQCPRWGQNAKISQ